MQFQISIIILHYNDANLTSTFLDNLKKLNWHKISHHFIIVDNYSPDESGPILESYYEYDPTVTVLLNKENLGFAKGNNIGICYAWENFHSDLIIVSNNDIKILDNDFPQSLLRSYYKGEYAVIGPDIYSLSKEIHQSPIRKKPLNREQLELKIFHIDNTLHALYIIKKLHIYDLIRHIKRILGKKPGTKGYQHKNPHEDVVLHGAFFILSRKYMEQYPDGLYNQTFLYMEEDILAHRCRKKHLKTLYTPELSVFHIDGYTTTKQTGNRCNKYIFELTETKKSCQIMLNMIQMENNNSNSSKELIL